MFPRSMIAVVALTTVAVSVGCTHSSLGRPTRARQGDIVKMTEVAFKDDEGHKLVFRFDDSGNVSATEGSRDGKQLPVKTFPLKGSFLCLEGEPSKQTCAPIQFVSDGTLIKIGKDTCLCGNWGPGGAWMCIGYPTCP